MITDEDLFRAWQHGDAGALETLVQRYHAPLLAHLYRVLADTHLAEDLVQEAGNQEKEGTGIGYIRTPVPRREVTDRIRRRYQRDRCRYRNRSR